MKSVSNQFVEKNVSEFCAMCGAINGDVWQTQPMQNIVLDSYSRYGDAEQIWILCNECSEGLQNTALPKPDQIHLLAQIRRATISDQEVVLNWLLQKFNLTTGNKN